jgi:flagellar motility protein MotE (MotC chaperone)
MSRTPRILPLVGVAIGGVIAVNALAGAHAVPQLLSATQAAAEEALRPSKDSKAAKTSDKAPAANAPPAAAAPALAPPGAARPAPGMAPICAPSPTELAKAAGLSPAELQVLQNLQARRGQIDNREKDLDTEVQLLTAAEVKLDAKLKAMSSLKADIQALMGEADQKTQAEVDRLVVVYSKMKPQDAAAVMAQLDDKVRLPIAAAMKPTVLSQILSKMGTMEAKALTEKLAHRFAPMQAIADAAPGANKSAGAAPASAPPASAPQGGQDGAADAASPPPAAAKSPRRTARSAQARHKKPRPHVAKPGDAGEA